MTPLHSPPVQPSRPPKPSTSRCPRRPALWSGILESLLPAWQPASCPTVVRPGCLWELYMGGNEVLPTQDHLQASCCVKKMKSLFVSVTVGQVFCYSQLKHYEHRSVKQPGFQVIASNVMAGSRVRGGKCGIDNVTNCSGWNSLDSRGHFIQC